MEEPRVAPRMWAWVARMEKEFPDPLAPVCFLATQAPERRGAVGLSPRPLIPGLLFSLPSVPSAHRQNLIEDKHKDKCPQLPQVQYGIVIRTHPKGNATVKCDVIEQLPEFRAKGPTGTAQ